MSDPAHLPVGVHRLEFEIEEGSHPTPWRLKLRARIREGHSGITLAVGTGATLDEAIQDAVAIISARLAKEERDGAT